MSFTPSRYSDGYDGWIEDAGFAIGQKVGFVASEASKAKDAAVDTALAPVRAAAATVADARAAAEAARAAAEKGAEALPWIVGGLVLVGGMWMASRRRANPTLSEWVAGSTVGRGIGSGRQTVREVWDAPSHRGRVEAYGRGVARGAGIAVRDADTVFTPLLRALGFPL